MGHPIIGISDYRRRFSTAQNKKNYFIFVLLKFNKYIFISPVMQMKFQAAGAVQVLALRCTCHHTLAFKNLINGASDYRCQFSTARMKINRMVYIRSITKILKKLPILNRF